MNGARGKDPGQDINVYMEYINNVNYNWGAKWLLMEEWTSHKIRNIMDGHVTFVNNYYKPGPATTARVEGTEILPSIKCT